MSEWKAAPRLMDTGTIFAETKVCANCGQAIERGDPKLAGYAAVGPWVHSDGKSRYCPERNT